MFNFVIEPEKKSIDINSTLFQCETENYIKLLYNNQGIVYKFGDIYKAGHIYINEIVIPITESLLNRKNVISIYCTSLNNTYLEKIIVYVNSNKIYEESLMIDPSFFDHQYHNFYLANNNDNSKSFYGKFYDYSMLQNISDSEVINLHEYCKYIHNI